MLTPGVQERTLLAFASARRKQGATPERSTPGAATLAQAQVGCRIELEVSQDDHFACAAAAQPVRVVFGLGENDSKAAQRRAQQL